MAFSLRNFLRGVGNDVNIFDHGKSSGNQYNAPPPPASTAQPTNLQRGQQSIQNANQQVQSQPAKYGVLANPGYKAQFLGSQAGGNGFNPVVAGASSFATPFISTAKLPYDLARLGTATVARPFNNGVALQNAAKATTNDATNSFGGFAVDAAKSGIGAVLQPYEMNKANQAEAYANKVLGDAYAPYQNGRNIAETEAGQAKLNLLKDALSNSGASYTDRPLNTALKAIPKIGAGVAQAELLNVPGSLPLAAQSLESGTLMGTAAILNASAQDNAKPGDVLKAGALPALQGAALPLVTHGVSKAAGVTTKLVNERVPLDQSGYLSWAGSDKLTPEQYKIEAAKRLSQAASSEFAPDSAAGKQPGFRGDKTSSNKIAREYQRNPQKFMDKYQVEQPPIVGSPIPQTTALVRQSDAIRPQAESMVQKATVDQVKLNEVVNSLAKNMGQTVTEGKPKSVGRIIQKTIEENNGDIGKIRDSARAMMTVDGPHQLDQVLSGIEGKYPVTRIKNGFDNPTPAGYKDIKVNVRLPGGHEGEIILTTKEMLNAAKTQNMHALYDKTRVSGFDGNIQRLNDIMKKHYTAADEAATSRLNSSSDMGTPRSNAFITPNGLPNPVEPTISEPSSSNLTGTSPTSKNIGNFNSAGDKSFIPPIIQDNAGGVKTTTTLASSEPKITGSPGEIPKEPTTTPPLADNAPAPIVGSKMANTVETSQKMTAPKLEEVSKGSSKPKVQPNDAIVNTQPLDINLSSKATGIKERTGKQLAGANETTTDIRKAYSGDKNSQIVRGNQIAEGIRKITTPEDRRAMTWLNEAGGDVNTLQKWASDTSPTLDPHRADIQHALDIAQNPSDAYHAMQGYYHASGAAGVKLGSIKDTIENYNNRIYKQDNLIKPVTGDAKNPALKLTTGHAKQRTFATLYDAVKNGKIPATTDAADLLAIHNEEMARVNANHKLTDTLKANNLGEWVSGTTAPAGMSKLDGIQKTGSFIDKEGNPRVAVKTFAVPDYLASGFKAITEPDYTKRIDSLRKIGKYQGLVKTVDLSVSAFHHFTFAMQALYQTKGGLDLLNPKFWDRLKSQDFNKLEQDFTAHTGMTSNIDANMDVMRALTKGDSRLGNIPVVKQIISGVKKNNDFLFGTLQRQLKVTDYGLKISKWVDKHPNATNDEVTAAKRSIATEINAAYGGLNWEAMGVNKSNIGLLRKVLLAPDWTISNLQLGKQVFKGGPGGAAARSHVASAIIAGTALTEGLNYAITGHSSLQNGKGHEFEVEVRPGVYVSFFRGGIGDMLKLGSRIQQSGPIGGTSQFLQGKLAPWARTGTGLITNTDYYGSTIASKKDGIVGSTKKELSYILNSGGPVPFGLSAVKNLAVNGISDPVSYGLVGSGLARPGSTKELQSVNSSGDSQKLRNLDKNQLEQYGALPGDQKQAFLDKTNANQKVNQEKAKAKDAANISYLAVNGKITKTSDGKLYAKVGNSYRTFSSQQELDHAKAEQNFKDSGKTNQTVGDTYFYKTKTGGVGSKPKTQYDYQTTKSSTDLALSQAKNSGNLNSWLDNATKQYQAIDSYKKTLDPNSDQVEINSLTKQQDSLKANAQKYGSYGGFTKAKTSKAKGARGAKTVKVKGYGAPKFSSGTSSFGALRKLVKGSSYKRKAIKV